MNNEHTFSVQFANRIIDKLDINHHRKYHTKYINKLSLLSQSIITEKGPWLTFFKRAKIISKLTSVAAKKHYFQPSLDLAVDALKSRRSLKVLSIYTDLNKNKVKNSQLLLCKVLTNLKSVQKLDLSIQGSAQDVLADIFHRISPLSRLFVFKIHVSIPSNDYIDLSKAVQAFYRTLNRLHRLDHVTFDPKNIRLSDECLHDIFQFSKLRTPIRVFDILTERLDNIEDDADDFHNEDDDEIEQEGNTKPKKLKANLGPIKLWQEFSNIKALAKSLQYLNLQPLLRTAADQDKLKYFFSPLGDLENLSTLILGAPNLELCDDDVIALTGSFGSFQNLKKFDLRFQFGVIRPKVLEDFFDSMKHLNLLEMGIDLNFASTTDYTKFFNAIGHNKELRVMRFDMVFLGKFILESSFCDLIYNCKSLDNLDITLIPVMNLDEEGVSEINTCFRKMVDALANTRMIKKFRCTNPKLAGDNTNLDCVTKMVENTPNLEELSVCPNMVGYSIDGETGMRFWQTVVKRTNLKKLVLTVTFTEADRIISFIRNKIGSLKLLENVLLSFQSETLGAEQIVWLVRKIEKWEYLREVHLHFIARCFVGGKTLDKIQEVLRKPQLLEKGVVEIESPEGLQVIDPKHKTFTRRE